MIRHKRRISLFLPFYIWVSLQKGGKLRESPPKSIIGFQFLSCHYRARRSFWTCLKMNTGAWRLVGLHLKSLFFSPWKMNPDLPGAIRALVCMYVCMLQSKPLNVEYLMMDASVLLPPTGTPLTGIDFVKRLPCGDVEKTRRVCTHTNIHTHWSSVNTASNIWIWSQCQSQVVRFLGSQVLELKYEFPLKAEAN